MLLWWANQEHVLPESIAAFKCTWEAAASEMSICCWLIIIIIIIKKVKFTIILISYILFYIFIFYIYWYCHFSIAYLCMLKNFFSHWEVSEYRNCHVDCSCMEYCDVLQYQLVGLSFWRHPFNADDPLVNKWCDNTFLQVCSDGKTNLQLGLPEVSTFLSNFHCWVNYYLNVFIVRKLIPIASWYY